MKDLRSRVIKKTFLKKIALVFFIFFIFLSASVFIIIYITEQNNIDQIMNKRAIAIKDITAQYIASISDDVEFISNIQGIKNSPIDNEELQDSISLFKHFKQIHSDIDLVYAKYFNGKQFADNYKLMDSLGLDSSQILYDGILRQNIHIKISDKHIYIIKTLLDINNKTSGIFVAVYNMKKINKILGKNRDSKNLIINHKGKVVLADAELNPKKKLLNFLGLNMNSQRLNKYVNSKVFNTDSTIYFKHIDGSNLIILVIVNRNKILKLMLIKYLYLIVIIAIFMLVFAAFVAFTAAKMFVTPISELKNILHLIIVNSTSDKLDFGPYSKNEVQSILYDIKELTQNKLEEKNLKLRNLNDKLEELSLTDPLTGLFNRRKMNIEITREYNRAKRYNGCFSLIMFDIDWFKGINDAFGHQVGDVVLKRLSELAIDSVRSADSVGRWGGEEFLILCTETDLDTAYLLAQRLRIATQNLKIENIDKSITISLGVVQFRSKENIGDLLKRVDDRLYEAKQEGRNRVIM